VAHDLRGNHVPKAFSLQANQAASDAQWKLLQESAPENPFLTAEYALARQHLGETPVMLEFGSQQCPAFLRRGRITSGLEIISLPFVPSSLFLSGLIAFCRDMRVYETALHSFGSPALSIPKLPREIQRRARTEFVIDLTVATSQWKIGETHRRHIRRAEKSAVSVRRVEAEGIPEHLSMCRHSMSRRQERGETVYSVTDSPEIPSIVINGAGQIFQALRDDVVLSSILIIRSRAGAYYHSAGTSQEGMAIGASHFLVHSVARTLQEQGVKVFNLGGAEIENQGLRAFKSRFGASPVETEAVRAVLCGPVHRRFVQACYALKKIAAR
jgi:lipid II:glycine glycyltransferase (peptidoglycan interpeptide bridge formation enzyme)